MSTRIKHADRPQLHSDTREMMSISSIASPETRIVTIHTDSNELTMSNGFGQQL